MSDSLELAAPKLPDNMFQIPAYVSMKPWTGTDPELFFVDGKGDLLPAFNFLKPKGDGKGFTFLGNEGYKGKTFWDGFQAEFSTTRPNSCLMFHNFAVRAGINALYEQALEFDKKAKPTIQSVVRIPEALMAASKDNHIELGCEPSENVYGLKGDNVPNPRGLAFRFAGGHIHYGQGDMPSYSEKRVKTIIKTLDKILGIWSVGAAQDYDNPIRRQYYGLPGEYRQPKHGIEYRTLSNFWMSAPVISHATFEVGRRALQLACSDFHELWVAPEQLVIETIRNSDVKTAKKILKHNKPMFEWMFESRGWSKSTVDLLLKVGLEGMDLIVKDTDAIIKNWSIGEYDAKDFGTWNTSHPKYTFNGYADKTYTSKV